MERDGQFGCVASSGPLRHREYSRHSPYPHAHHIPRKIHHAPIWALSRASCWLSWHFVRYVLFLGLALITKSPVGLDVGELVVHVSRHTPHLVI